jgi:hypothetical protein
MELHINRKTIVLSSIFLLFSYLIYLQFNTQYKLRNYGFWTTGVIIEEGKVYKGGLKFTYEFYIGHTKFRGDASGVSLYNDSGKDFLGKSFPIVYYSKDPNLNMMVIVPAHFKFLNKEYPDSLNWVLEYLR